MRQLLERYDERGYTLIESLFQLIILAILVQFFLLFFLWKGPIERQYFNMSATDWELFAVDFQQLLSDIDQIDVHNDNRGIQLKNSRGTIDVEQGNAVIRKRIFGNGHVPLLTNIHSAFFSLDGLYLFVQVKMLDGTQKERKFVVGLHSK